MQNTDAWQSTKFIRRNGVLRASRDLRAVSAGSRLNVELVAAFYHRTLPKYARGRLLDLGCGAVPLYEAYRSHVSDIVCVDWEKSAHSSSYVDQTCDLNGALPFEDNSFDTVILSDVLEHLCKPETCWQSMARVTRRGGNVIMNVPFYYPLHEQPFDYFRYTEFALRRFASESGFAVVELDILGGAPEVITDIAAKLLAGRRLGRNLALALQFLCLGLRHLPGGGNLSKRTAQRFPLGYAMVAERL